MATILDGYRRPAVIFDAKNQQHRRWAHQFLKDRSWRNVPVQMVLPDGDDNAVTTVNRELVRYYLSKEFTKLPMTDQDRIYQFHVAEMPETTVSK